MPEGVRNNGISKGTGKASRKKREGPFLPGEGDEGSEDGESDGIHNDNNNGNGILYCNGKVRGRRKTKGKSTNTRKPPNHLNFNDLLNIGAMVEDNTKESSTLEATSSSRDADYVVLMLNQKQREDSQVNMLIDRLQGTGITCLFIKNGTNSSTGDNKKSRSTSLPPLSDGSEVSVNVHSDHILPEVQSKSMSKSIPKPKESSESCNGESSIGSKKEVVKDMEPSQSGDSVTDPSKDGVEPSKSMDDASSSPIAITGSEGLESFPTSLILRIPLPGLKLSSTITKPVFTEPLLESLPLLNPFPTLNSLKRKRRRRKQYPYRERKQKKKKVISVEELITVLDSDIAASTTNKDDDKPTRLSVLSGFKAARKLQPSRSFVTKKKRLIKRSTRPNLAKTLKGRKNIIKKKKAQPLSSDPYVFIPEDDVEEEPVIKLFSPRKNGLCSPALEILDVKEQSNTKENNEEQPSGSKVPETIENDEKVKKPKRKKRPNEISQLLTWHIAPRPSTPRCTGTSQAFFTKGKDTEAAKVSTVKEEEEEDKLLEGVEKKETEEKVEAIIPEEIKEVLDPEPLKTLESESEMAPLPFTRTPTGHRRGKVTKRKIETCKAHKGKIAAEKKRKISQKTIDTDKSAAKDVETDTEIQIPIPTTEGCLSETVQVQASENVNVNCAIKQQEKAQEDEIKDKITQEFKLDTIGMDSSLGKDTICINLEAMADTKDEKVTEPAPAVLDPELKEPPKESSQSDPDADLFKVPALPPPSLTKLDPQLQTSPSTSFLDVMQLRHGSSFYSQISGNVRNNMENFLDGRPPSMDTDSKHKRRRRVRPRNGFLLHHGDNFPEDPEAPYRLHLATQILLKLNKRRSKFKPKEDKGKSLLSYLKLFPKRFSRTSKPINDPPIPINQDSEDSRTKGNLEDEEANICSVFSGEWTQTRFYVCNICGQVEKCFMDMVHHKGEIHPGIVVTHVELAELPPKGFREPPRPVNVSVLPSVPACTKCSATFTSYSDLHLHIFECAGHKSWLEEPKVVEPQTKKKKRKRCRGFNSFKRRLSNTPKKCNPIQSASPQKRREEVFKCDFCTRLFKTEGWLKNHLTTHSLPISIPLDKLKQTLPNRASNTSGRRSIVQNLLANGTFKS